MRRVLSWQRTLTLTSHDERAFECCCTLILDIIWHYLRKWMCPPTRVELHCLLHSGTHLQYHRRWKCHTRKNDVAPRVARLVSRHESMTAIEANYFDTIWLSSCVCVLDRRGTTCCCAGIRATSAASTKSVYRRVKSGSRTSFCTISESSRIDFFSWFNACSFKHCRTQWELQQQVHGCSAWHSQNALIHTLSWP